MFLSGKIDKECPSILRYIIQRFGMLATSNPALLLQELGDGLFRKGA